MKLGINVITLDYINTQYFLIPKFSNDDMADARSGSNITATHFRRLWGGGHLK